MFEESIILMLLANSYIETGLKTKNDLILSYGLIILLNITKT